jgi:hypothetical protein
MLIIPSNFFLFYSAKWKVINVIETINDIFILI